MRQTPETFVPPDFDFSIWADKFATAAPVLMVIFTFMLGCILAGWLLGWWPMNREREKLWELIHRYLDRENRKE